MAPKNRVGTFSLLISSVGFVGIEAGHILAGFDGVVWVLARGGFEAAVIGGLADWFAVRAIFHAIPPRPLPALPHTNLVVANRSKLTDGLVDFVEHQLLGPTVLKERLAAFSASRLIFAALESETGRAVAVSALLAIAQRLTRELEDDERLRVVVADAIRERLRGVDLAPWLGCWLLQRVEAGDTAKAWMWAARALADDVESGALDAVLADIMTATLGSLREEHTWRGMAFGWFISPQHDLRYVRSALTDILRHEANDPKHPWNGRLHAFVTSLAQRLLARDPPTVARLQAVQEHLAATLDLQSLVTLLAPGLSLISQHKPQYSADESRRSLTDLMTHLVGRLRADTAAHERIDGWVRDRLQELAARYHGVIGITARESLDRLANETLVAELETKIGQDLEFIRLNGAVIGGSVGVAIAAARLLAA